MEQTLQKDRASKEKEVEGLVVRLDNLKDQLQDLQMEIAKTENALKVAKDELHRAKFRRATSEILRGVAVDPTQKWTSTTCLPSTVVLYKIDDLDAMFRTTHQLEISYACPFDQKEEQTVTITVHNLYSQYGGRHIKIS